MFLQRPDGPGSKNISTGITFNPLRPYAHSEDILCKIYTVDLLLYCGQIQQIIMVLVGTTLCLNKGIVLWPSHCYL